MVVKAILEAGSEIATVMTWRETTVMTWRETEKRKRERERVIGKGEREREMENGEILSQIYREGG